MYALDINVPNGSNEVKIMCTSPNYVVWEGDYYYPSQRIKKRVTDDNDKLIAISSDYVRDIKTNYDKLVPKFKFIGKQPYHRMIDLSSPWVQVPCGQCLECRIQQARTWADRVVLESKKYKHNYFVTLTYSDNNIPGFFSLVPDDLSRFIKNIRNQFRDVKIRFFGCGEYGDISRRPHYHVILFNCPLNDLSYNFKEPTTHFNEDGKLVLDRLVNHIRPNNNGDLKYSDTIMKAWNYKGIISVGEVTYDSAAYVSQYVTKKHKPGMADFYKRNNLVPEFVRMSTHPGLASDYFHDHDDYLLFQGNMIVPSKGEAHLSVTPRYFDKLFIKKYGDDLFLPIRSKRYVQRVNTLNRYCHDSLDKDSLSFNRDYKIKKQHKLKEQI